LKQTHTLQVRFTLALHKRFITAPLNCSYNSVLLRIVFILIHFLENTDAMM